jgi:hypothetical protein
MEDWQYCRFIKSDLGSTALTTMIHQVHEGWASGAMAELVDNALEAGAKSLDVQLVTPDSEDRQLILTDDGVGLDRPALDRMLKLGCDTGTQKSYNHYGVGLKSGSLGLGDSVLVFTKTMECELHVGKLDTERLQCREKCTARKVLIRGFAVLSKNLVEPKLVIPVILWLPNGKPVIKRPTAEEFNEPADGRVAVVLKELKSDPSPDFTVLMNTIWNTFRMRLPEIQSHFESISTETGTRVVVLMDKQRDPVFTTVLGNDIEIFRTRRHRSGRPDNILMDFSVWAYLELIYRKADIAMTLNGKTIFPWNFEDRLWGKIEKQIKIKHRVFSKGMLTESRKESTLDVTLGFSPEDYCLGACGFFIYFINTQTQTRRLVLSYHRPAVSFMTGLGSGKGGNRRSVNGMIGVIELDDSMVKVDNGKQKFSEQSVDHFFTALDNELARCVREYYDDSFFQTLQRMNGFTAYVPAP